ncbi:MAG: hypothetical protein AB1711_05825 [Thermodesulfobacteriota bacterium]
MNCDIRSWHYAFVLLLLFFASAALADETNSRNYPLPNHGSIQLQVPSGWEDHLTQPPNRLPPTIKFTQKKGSTFSMLITPLWPANENIKLPDGDNLKKSVQKAADKIASRAVEKKISLMELKGPSAQGFYFSVTDSEPKPGDYKYLTQGHIRVGDLMAIFTILTNDGQDSIVSDCLELMKSAKQNKEASSSPSESIEIRNLKGVFRLTVPISRLVITIPKGNLSLAKNTLGGSADNPRYFYFRDEELKLNISGWFEPEQSYLGTKVLWENVTREWKRGGLPDPQNVTFMKIANWDIIVYDILHPSGSSSNSHIKAHWLQAGTWIEVHISMTSDASSTEIRTKLLALLNTFEVTEKK